MHACMHAHACMRLRRLHACLPACPPAPWRKLHVHLQGKHPPKEYVVWTFVVVVFPTARSCELVVALLGL